MNVVKRGTLGVLTVVAIAFGAVFAQAGPVTCEDVCSDPQLTVTYDECIALTTLFALNGGESRTNNQNRTISPDVATRWGVVLTTGAAPHHVQELILPSNNLTGALPAALSSLTSLSRLDLQNNHITSLPSSLANFSQLEELIVAQNKLTTLPDMFTNRGSLDLLRAEQNLITTLPTSIGYLYELDLLDLSNNNLTSLPSTIGSLDDLDILKVGHNQLIVLPDPISDLDQLSLLDAQDNFLTVWPAQIDQLATLESLQLENNRFTSVPPAVFSLPSLYHLNLRNNFITALPTGRAGSTSLEILDVGSNRLTDLPDELTSLQGLTQLYLHENRVTSFSPSFFSLPSLQLLHLGFNRLTGGLPESFTQLNALTYLDVSYNILDHIAGGDVRIPDSLQAWTTRAGFALHGEGQEQVGTSSWLSSSSTEPFPHLITDAITQSVQITPAMRMSMDNEQQPTVIISGENPLCAQLQVSLTLNQAGTYDLELNPQIPGVYAGCQIQMVDKWGELTSPRDIPTLTVVTDTQAAFCDNPEVTVDQESCLALLELYSATEGKTWYRADGWFITPNIEDWYGIESIQLPGSSKRKITGLYLHSNNWSAGKSPITGSGNNLQGTLPDIFMNLPDLETLALGNNKLSGSLPPSLGTVTPLSFLYLQNNKISGSLTSILAGLTSLRRISVQNNKLSGELSTAFITNTLLEAVDIRNNSFSGLLPQFSSQAPIRYVHAANNLFTGPLPANRATFLAREHLYLQGNKLTGTIPSLRTQWSGLHYLDLSANALDRTIDGYALLGDEQSNRWQSLTQKQRGNQLDIQAPEIELIGGWSEISGGTYQLTLNIQENNYAINAAGAGMQGVISGCTGLTVSDTLVSTGQTTIQVTVAKAGIYEGCSLTIRDHGENYSNSVSLPLLGYNLGEQSLCLQPTLSIPREECFALRDLYTATQGENWTNHNNWRQTPQVDNRFGVQTAIKDGKEHVTQLLLHRNELTSVHDPVVPQAKGNNLVGVLPDSLRDLHYLTIFRGDDNQLSGTPRDALVSMDNLDVLTLANNKMTGVLPTHWGGFTHLSTLDLSNNLFTGGLPSSRKGLSDLQVLRLGKNQLGGTIEISSGDWGKLETVDVSFNSFTGSIDPDRSMQNSLQEFLVNDNYFKGSLPGSFAALTGLNILSLSNNQLAGPLPISLQTLTNLREFSASGNAFFGDINAVFPFWTSLELLDVTANKFTGRLGNQRAARTLLQTVLLSHNHLDRTVTHETILGSGIIGWTTTRDLIHLEDQQDSTPPKLTTATTLRSPVRNTQKILLNREENSYAVNADGTGMSLEVGGGSLCGSVRINTGSLFTQTGIITLLFQPEFPGVYTCRLTVRDQAGNEGRLQLTPFLYETSCGDGSIVAPEECDEGRFCDQETATECTQDNSTCPFSCVTQMIDNCTPACKQSACGDRFVDANGLDNILGSQDDELCDVGSFCADGRDCTNNPSLCPGGPAACQTRFTASCSPVCAPSNCGDGVLDEAGVNDLLDDEDDEDCDDGNTISGDGCSSSCKVEYCGDGFVDANGKDQQPGTADDEECDLGPGNGLRAGQCNQFCKVNEQTCQWCFETCQGGTGQHSIYLLIDVSGSMEGNKMAKAKQGAIDFVQHIMSGAALNSGFISKIGLIKFSSNGSVVQEPTTNYIQLISLIQSLQAGGSTNFGDALNDAKSYFQSHDGGFDKHIVLLSDGLPTVGPRGMSAEEYSLDAADAVKALGVNIYTIAVEQTEEGIEFMRKVSSASYLNLASGKPTSQSSTQSSRHASRAVDADKSNYAQTKNNNEAWREVDLGSSLMVREVKVWNRTNLTNDTSDFWVLTSSTPFVSENLNATLSQSGVNALYVTGTAQRPTTLLFDKTARYVRVQLVGTDKLALAEVEVFGCSGTGNCDWVFSFEDYTSEVISTLYGHIFGAIHCGCGPVQVCGICGDGHVDPTYGEVCDEGSFCDNGTECSADPSLCPTECKPRTSQTCTQLCQLPSCGDGVVQSSLGESCDDGNMKEGDGCTATCLLESCGDGFIDVNGIDQVLGTLDDEQCDDGNMIHGDGCTATCKAEFCGDGLVLGNELCDTGRSCEDGTDCTTNPWVCPGQCQTRFSESCAPDCTFGYCGDVIVDSDGVNNILGDSDDEECDPGKFCPNGIPCSNDESLCPGACEVTFTPTCTQYCKTTYCGDGFIDLDGVDEQFETIYDNEQCDDGNGVNGDGCSINCQLEGEDGCFGSGCLSTCGDGTKQFFEPCDATDSNDSLSVFCTDICTLSVCGDGIVFSGEECDEGKWCDDGTTSCTTDPTLCPSGPSECKTKYIKGCTQECTKGCGDGVLQSAGVDKVVGTDDDEFCDDGNVRESDACTNTCTLPSCGDGIVTYYAQLPTATGMVVYFETCDDGNTDDGDSCPSTCIGSGGAMTGQCSTTVQASDFYDEANVSFADITRFCEVGIPEGSPVYNEETNQWEWWCRGILGGSDTACSLPSWSCGDGIVDIWQDEKTGMQVQEACDDGNKENGDGCTDRCQFENPFTFGETKSCASTTYPTIQPGEVMPLWWEGTSEALLFTGLCDSAPQNTLMHGDAIMCTFTISRGNPDGYTEHVGTFEAPCLTNFAQVTGGALIRDALLDQGQSLESVLGGTSISSDEQEQRLRNEVDGSYVYGQYRLALTNISFTYCARTRTKTASGTIETNQIREQLPRTYTTTLPLCNGNRTVLPGYFMQQQVLFSEQPNTGLQQAITNLSGDQLYIDDSSYDQSDSLVKYSGPEKTYLFNQIIEKYQPLATDRYTISTVNDSSTTFKKVPNSHVYVYTESHDLEIEWNQIEYLLLQAGVSSADTTKTPFTLIVPDSRAELHLIGDIPGRGMYVAKNSIAFIAQNCDENDVVQGIFVTNGQFTTTNTINTQPGASSRCNKGGLTINGLMLGGDISVTLSNIRRATLNLRENEQQRYADETNAPYIINQLYQRCYEIPLLFDAVGHVLGKTSVDFGGPFSGCTLENRDSFGGIHEEAMKKLLRRIWEPGGFLDKAFHEQNTLTSKTLLTLLPPKTTLGATQSGTTSLITTFSYDDLVYTREIPSRKMNQISSLDKQLPSFRGGEINLNDPKLRLSFFTWLGGLVGSPESRMTHLAHPLQEGNPSLHTLFEKVWGSAYTESLLQQLDASNGFCMQEFRGSDNRFYTDQRSCLLTYTPLYRWMIEQSTTYKTKKSEKDAKILEGASVQVRSAPFIRQSPPPGARDLLNAMKITF